MVTLTRQEINTIHDFLVDCGVDYEPLRNDLLDHICCSIEEKMDRGMPFREAFHLSVEEFGEEGLEKTQQITMYLLTQKDRVMKNIASITGITGAFLTIIGFGLKLLHLPPAGILLVSGLTIIALFFLPLILIIKLKEYKSVNGKLAIVAGVLSAALLVFGMMFKLMHWPYANMLTHLGMGVLCLLFMPLHFIRSYQQAENRIFNSALVAVIFAGSLLLFGMTGNTHMHKSQKAIEALNKNLNTALKANYQFERMINQAQDQNGSLQKSINPLKKAIQIINKAEKALFDLAGYTYVPGQEYNGDKINWNLPLADISNLMSAQIIPDLEQTLMKDVSNWTKQDTSENPSLQLQIQYELDAFKGESYSSRLVDLPLYDVLENLQILKRICLNAQMMLNQNHP